MRAVAAAFVAALALTAWPAAGCLVGGTILAPISFLALWTGRAGVARPAASLSCTDCHRNSPSVSRNAISTPRSPGCFGSRSFSLFVPTYTRPRLSTAMRNGLPRLALTAGPQFLGHSVVNRVLRTTSATVVSVAILFEIVGATLLAWLAFGERPPAGAYPAAVLIAAGIVLVVLSGRTTEVAPVVD